MELVPLESEICSKRQRNPLQVSYLSMSLIQLENKEVEVGQEEMMRWNKQLINCSLKWMALPIHLE